MPVTQEPRGLMWINNVAMTSFGSLVTNACWFIGSVSLTVVACILLLRLDGPSLTNGIPTSHEAQRQLGFALAGILLGAWTGKTVAGVTDAHLKRTANPEYVPVIEAKERGKVAGAAASVAIAEKAADLKMTREHPVPAAAAPVTITAQDQATVKVEAGAAVAAPDAPSPEHEWASGDPREGVL